MSGKHCRKREQLRLFLFVLFFPLQHGIEPHFGAHLAALLGRDVIPLPAQRFGQALHVRDLVGGVVGVDIALAVVQLAHEPGRGVAELEGDRLVQHGDRVGLGVLVGGVEGI